MNHVYVATMQSSKYKISQDVISGSDLGQGINQIINNSSPQPAAISNALSFHLSPLALILLGVAFVVICGVGVSRHYRLRLKK